MLLRWASASKDKSTAIRDTLCLKTVVSLLVRPIRWLNRCEGVSLSRYESALIANKLTTGEGNLWRGWKNETEET
jgi:hypothetical protein